MRILPLLTLIVAAAALSACSGYLLNNKKSVTPTMAESASRSDPALAEAVARALSGDARFAEIEANAGSRAGEVTLKGRVASFEARDDALVIARNTGGVSRVNNQIEVNTRN